MGDHCVSGHHFYQIESQPGIVANPVWRQLKYKNNIPRPFSCLKSQSSVLLSADLSCASLFILHTLAESGATFII